MRLLYDWLGGFRKTSRRFWNHLRNGGAREVVADLLDRRRPDLLRELDDVRREVMELLGAETDAEAIARKAMGIAADICVYTNHNLVIEKL